MSAWAKPGVKCVCVGGGRKPGWPERINDLGYRGKPKIGDICVVTGTSWVEPYGLFLKLEGYPRNQSFLAAAFRPLITKTQEQDVALFRHILDGLPVGEDA